MSPHRPRLVYVITDSGVGGSEKVIHTLLKNINRNVIDPVGVVVLKQKRDMVPMWESTGTPVFSLGMNKIPSPLVVFRLAQKLKELNPTLVHAFLYHSAQLSRVVHKLTPSFKLITSPRVNYRFVSPFFRLVDRALRHEDNLTITEGLATQQFLVSQMGYEKSNVVTIGNSVDAGQYHFQEDYRKKWRELWQISDDTLVIGAVGRFHPQKGFDFLLKSLLLLKKIPQKYILVLAGEGKEKKSLELFVSRHQLPVKFIGLNTIMTEVYSAFDIFVQSSLYEGMSNALLEAMSVGVPIVATGVDGTLDVAQNESNMLLVQPGSAEDLARGLGLLIQNHDMRRAMSSRARDTASSLTQEKMVRDFENAYDATLKGK